MPAKKSRKRSGVQLAIPLLASVPLALAGCNDTVLIPVEDGSGGGGSTNTGGSGGTNTGGSGGTNTGGGGTDTGGGGGGANQDPSDPRQPGTTFRDRVRAYCDALADCADPLGEEPTYAAECTGYFMSYTTHMSPGCREVYGSYLACLAVNSTCEIYESEYFGPTPELYSSDCDQYYDMYYYACYDDYDYDYD